jgi:cytochrome c oxidase subunit 3
MHQRADQPMPPEGLTLREDQLRLGLWIFLATVSMLFAAFTSAYIVRRSGTDWQHVALPGILWMNTLVLAASSAALEAAYSSGSRAQWQRATLAVAAAALLGVLFLAGQIAAWRQMVASGVYMPTSPHSSFFYMLTGAHALHIVAALGVLLWCAGRTWVARHNPTGWAASMDLGRTFWHYLGAIWVFLFALVSLY